MTADVQASDIDEQGHVSNVTYVRWVQDVAKAHSAAVGLDHPAYVRLGAIFVVRRHEVDYLRPAVADDQVALVTRISWWRGATCERRTRIFRISDGADLASGVTLWVLVSTATGRPRRIPRHVVEAFTRTAPVG